MGVLGVEGVAGPNAEFLLISSARSLGSTSSWSSSMPPSQAGEGGLGRGQDGSHRQTSKHTKGQTS